MESGADKYRKRIVEETFQGLLDAMGAVLIEGPKWCGKTTMAKRYAGSAIALDEEGEMENYLSLAATNPARLLKGEAPRLIDEWQLAPVLWDAVRKEVDKRNETGQFVLTGSSLPVDREKIVHSGAGRFGYLLMRPMSLYELGESTGNVSLKALFEGKEADGESRLDLERIAYLVCRGGWPFTLGKKEATTLIQSHQYFENIARTDYSKITGIRLSEERLRRLLRSYARNQGTQAGYATLAMDIEANDEVGIDEKTVSSYCDALRKIFIIEDSPAWNPSLRSKTAIRTSDTRYFVDPSIAANALEIGPDDLFGDMSYFGFLFETLAVRDLRVYVSSLGGRLYHYRDKNGGECDAVLHLKRGKYALVEIKLGGEAAIEEGAKSLLYLKNKLDLGEMKEPAFLMVLTAVGKYPYRRKDGVLVVPIGCLRN